MRRLFLCNAIITPHLTPTRVVVTTLDTGPRKEGREKDIKENNNDY